MKPNIQLHSGQFFDYSDKRTWTFSIQDIAHALSMICRYTGHCSHFYSVAQHSVYVSHIVPEHLAWEGLLHDAAEAYIGDVNKPLKCLLPEYQRIEEEVEEALMAHFGIDLPLDPAIKYADLQMLQAEKDALMNVVNVERWCGAEYWDSIKDIPMPDLVIRPLDPHAAKAAFLARFTELADKRRVA